MYALGSLLVVVAVSLLITRVAVVILVASGLPKQQARFQARSAFTGAGFTTTESEQIVNDPLRRRVVMFLMLLGNAGIVASAGSLIIGFNSGGSGPTFGKVAELAVGLFALLFASRSRWVDRWLTTLAFRALRRYTTVLAGGQEEMLSLPERHVVAEVAVRSADWIAERELEELRLRDQGVIVLGLKPASGRYQSTPPEPTVVHAGDTLFLYGPSRVIGSKLPQAMRGSRDAAAAEQPAAGAGRGKTEAASADPGVSAAVPDEGAHGSDAAAAPRSPGRSRSR